MTIYLYLKTHNKTGLKYLGQTSQDPYSYKGSGSRWINHLKCHGSEITTEILCESETHDEIKQAGIYYSKLWNIVKSNEFANLIEERGNTQYTPVSNKNIKQRGSKWITNGTVNKKLLKDEMLPEGFHYGRAGAVRNKKSDATRRKMSESHKARKRKVISHEYTCSHCKMNFKRKTKAKTENVFCSRSCRGKATPKISNPSGRNQYSKVKEL